MYYRLRRSSALMIAWLLATLLAACAKDTATEPEAEATASQLAQQGWQAFERQDVTGATSLFTQAIALDGQLAVAHLGLGCARLRSADGEADLQQAEASLGQAIAIASTAEARAARACVRLALGDFAGARDDAAAVSSAEPSFTFDHWSTFDWRTVAVVRAAAHAGLAECPEAVSAVIALRPHPLAVGDVDTWIVDGVRFDTFEAAAIALVGSSAREFALP